MSHEFIAQLDLAQAWSRTKHDLIDHRTFVSHPFLIDLIDSDTEGWLQSLREELLQGRYNPSACKICPVPKPGGGTRPGSDLSIEDQVTYSALIASARPQIQAALEWGEPPPDFAYRLRPDPSETRWFHNTFHLWKRFDENSIDLIDAGCSHVVVADIAGYYELIDITTLLSDLNGIGVSRDALEVLAKCLHRWVRIPRRGIPQGYSPSDVLGKLYLNHVDRSLVDEGIVHRRWVDDFRLFCSSESEARRALLRLCELLGSRGLVIQSAKTRILPALNARDQFRQVQTLLGPIRQEFLGQMVAVGALIGPSVTVIEIDEALAAGTGDEPVEVLRRAYDQHIAGRADINKTLFHFLLGRLGGARDGHALDHALTLLHACPDETDAVLAYCSKIQAVERVDEAWLALVERESITYEYQAYQILRWRSESVGAPAESFLRWVRPLAFEGSRSWYVRAAARRLIGRWGGAEDLERLHQWYPNADSDLEKAEVICTLARMEKGRRNAFLGHAGGDGPLSSRAARLVREGRIQ